jgi:hypothetical protein
MSTETTTEPEVKPDLGEAPPCWPPVAHLIRKEDEPAREGTIAICGAKLMGIDLGRLHQARAGTPVCKKCLDILAKELGL